MGERENCLWCCLFQRGMKSFVTGQTGSPWESSLGGCSGWDRAVQLGRAQPQTRPPWCLNNQLQGKSLWVTKLAGLRDWGLLMPGVIGFSAASLFILVLKQLHQTSVFTLAGCWRRLPLRWGVRGTGSHYQRLCRVSHAPPALLGLFRLDALLPAP